MLLIDISNKCQFGCEYCYADHEVPHIDVNKINETLLRFRNDNLFCFHGKEPLCELDAVERVSRFVRRNIPGMRLAMQSNGLAFSGRTAELLTELGIEVGFSLDGPWPLNRLRCTEEQTALVTGNIIRFIESGVKSGIISVLTKVNTPEVETMVSWAKEMISIGVNGFRFNPVLVKEDLEPTPDQMIAFYDAMIENDVNFAPWSECFKKECDRTCTFRGCDPDSSIVPIVLGNGAVSSCLKSKPDYEWAKPTGFRKALLSQLSYAEGGCKGCEVWKDCLGGCPFEGKDGIFRSKYCKVWKHLFTKASGRAAANTV